jgi:hypothetical protein
MSVAAEDVDAERRWLEIGIVRQIRRRQRARRRCGASDERRRQRSGRQNMSHLLLRFINVSPETNKRGNWLHRV